MSTKARQPLIRLQVTVYKNGDKELVGYIPQGSDLPDKILPAKTTTVLAEEMGRHVAQAIRTAEVCGK